jgi:lipopolysaccharide assembly outer membrane protein LptD (OstA)
MKNAPLVFFLFAFFLFLSPLLLFSQEDAANPQTEAGAESATEGATDGEAVTEEIPEKEKKMSPSGILERDIETATVEELSDWCRSLGLSVDGGKDALADRLREFYKLEKPVVVNVEPEDKKEEKKEPLTITIESAKTTEYFTVESVNEEYVRIKGGVTITLKDGDTLHRISADEILYNKTKEMMTASGGVVYVKKDANQSDGEETTFKGQGITINLNNWSTAFMEGVSDRSVGGGKTYRYSGEVISRSGDDSTVLRHARITNAESEEPYWSIDASRLWLLPGSDFAILNAVVKVGEIPLLWFPAFFYPGGEVVFHPVLGIKSREGTFFQTTTYILGQNKAKTETPEEFSSITNIMGGGEGMEQKREGMFLRSTGRKAVNASETNLSLMADAYSKLGYFIGSELSIPAKQNVGALAFEIGLAYSRDIYNDGGNYYTPFDDDGESNWHYSRLLNYEIPFPLRYRFKSTGSVSGSGSVARSMNLTWDLPFYSDPYIDNNFIDDRSTNSDVFTLLKNANKVESPTADYAKSSYYWNLTSGFSFATGILNPYINDFSLSPSLSVNFETKYTTPQPYAFSPNLRFFYPHKFLPVNISASIRGTPLSLGAETAKKNTETQDSGISWGEPNSPWAKDDEKDGETKDDEMLAFDFATLSRTTPSLLLGGHRFTVNYSINPTVSSEIRFNSNNTDPNLVWKKQEDVDWSDWAYQLFVYKIDGNMGFNLSEKQGLYSDNLTFTGSKWGQDYTYLNEEASEYSTPALQEATRRGAKSQTFLRSTWGNAFTFTPFLQSTVWKSTNLQYNVGGLLYKNEFDTTSDSYKEEWAEWTQEKITQNRFSANINANVMEYNQSLTITADIPPEKYDEEKTTTPKKPSISGTLGINAWISTTTITSGITDPFADAYYQNITIRETLKFGNATLSHSMLYFPQNDGHPLNTNNEKPGFSSMDTNFTWGRFNAGFRALRGKTMYLDTTPGQMGWKTNLADDDKLNPQSLNFGFSVDKAYKESANLEGNVNMNTSLNFNLQQYTNSNFTFTLSGTLKINQFLDITISSTSNNTQIYRYFRNMPFFKPIDVDIPGETNLFVDLLNSFRFDDIEKRKASGFKLRSLTLNLTHYLGDWKAKLDINLYPELNTTTRVYEFKNRVTFSVAWDPIQDFKTDIESSTDNGLKYNTK